MWQQLRSVPVIVIAAAALGAMWSTSAIAGCAKIGGTELCAAWIVSSEDQLDTITGLGNVNDNCAPGDTGCPALKAGVFGTNGGGNNLTNTTACAPTVPSNSNLGSDGFPVTDTPGNNCVIVGTLYCVNHGGNASKAQGQPFSISASLVNSITLSGKDCAKNGKCTASVDVEPTFSTDPCINPNWTPISFVASQFYGVSQLSWIDNQNVQEYENIIDYCSANLPSSYQPGQMYTCEPPATQ